MLKSVHGSWVGGQIAHSLAEERARFVQIAHSSWVGLAKSLTRLAEERARACTVLGSAAKSLTVLLKNVHGSWVGGQIAHSLAEERRACTVLGSAAKSLTVLVKSVHGSWVGGQIAHSLAEEGRRPNRSQLLRGSWVGGQIAHRLAEERARFLGRRPNRSQSC